MFRLQIPMNYLWRSCWVCRTPLTLAFKGSKPSVRKFLWEMDYYCYYFCGICHSVMLGECWVGGLDVCVGYFTFGNYQLCIRRPSAWTHLTRKYIWNFPTALYSCFKQINEGLSSLDPVEVVSSLQQVDRLLPTQKWQVSSRPRRGRSLTARTLKVCELPRNKYSTQRSPRCNWRDGVFASI